MKIYFLVAYLAITAISAWVTVWLCAKNDKSEDDTVKDVAAITIFWPLVLPCLAVFFFIAWPHYLYKYLQRRRANLPKATISK